MTNTTTHDVMVAQTEKAQELLDYFQGHRNGLEADRVAHAQAVAAQIENLKGVVGDQMYFVGVIDPSEENPTRVDGGTFNNVQDLCNRAPVGAIVEARFSAGQTYEFAGVSIAGKNLVLKRVGTGENPILRPGTSVNSTATHNQMAFVQLLVGAKLFLQGVDIELPSVKPDDTLPWSSSRTFVLYSAGGRADISVTNCRIFGGAAGFGLGLTSAHAGTNVDLSMWTVSIDGPNFAAVSAGSGVVRMARSNLTLTNGAAKYDGGVVGQNILEN